MPAATVAVLVSGCISGCGGSEQNAHEAKATFPVKIVQASFPSVQAIARSTKLVLKVRNTGASTMPNVAVTMDSFSYVSNFPQLSAPQRPVWIVDEGPGAIPKRPVQTVTVDPPGGGQTAYVNTWALGPLAPGHTKTFVWQVTPVKAGVHSIGFVVAAGLNGKAHARVSHNGTLEGTGGLPVGRFRVAITGRPPPRYVNPETGKVTRGTYPPGRYAQ
ncbi:MAG TPA: hypothetical protein VGY76_08045 [Solirubrobacteraceae bacterium]|nr:hypothetical protein [Solirubrobacteraceae bacterium]